MLRFLLYHFARFLSWLLVDLVIEGQEKLPASGPLLIVSNHFSWFEPPLLSIHLPYNIAWMAASEHQRFWLMRAAMKAFAAIPVKRGRVDRTALRHAYNRFTAGGVVGMMPEGGIDPVSVAEAEAGEAVLAIRGRTVRQPAKLIPARPGAGYLAVRSKVPILPIAFWGTEHIIANARKFKRTRVQMVIGQVIEGAEMPASSAKNRKKATQALSDKIMRAIAALMPASYRGHYE